MIFPDNVIQNICMDKNMTFLILEN